MEKILIRMPNWIGDAVMAMPAISRLRRAFPSAELCALALPIVAELIADHPDIDRIFRQDRGERHSGFLGRLRLLRALRSEAFDLVLLFTNSFESALMAVLAGISERWGYRRDGRGLLLTHGLDVPQGKRHQSVYYLALTETLIDRKGIRPAPGGGAYPDGSVGPPVLWLRPEERERSSDLPAPLIGLNPGAAYGPAKQWGPERFAAVADRLAATHGASIVLLGGPADRAVAEAVASAMSHPVRNMAGRTRLREAMGLIARCRLLISNDSGPMHVAGALGVPVVAVFGATDPEVTGPMGEGHRILRVVVRCAPCRFRSCPIDHRCMGRLDPDQVYEAASDLLSGAGRKGTPVVFLDRDGTLNPDEGYVDSPEKIALFPGAAEAVRRLNAAGLRVMVVTNQSGVGRGFFSLEVLEKIHRRLIGLMEQEGARLDAFYFCPHAPDRRRCTCRKPAPGMLLRAVQDAAADDPIDLSRSYVVGDRELDLLLGKAGGPRPILVRTGAGRETERRLSDFGLERVPVAEDLQEAVGWILQDRMQTEEG